MAEKPEDLSLPASVVARIIKDSLPEGVSVSKEARVAIGKAASVFILYCTACSNNFALQAKRKTLAASDVLSALSDMEFEEFVPELKSFLEAYKREQKGKRVAAADRRKQKAVASQAATTTDPQMPPVPNTSHTTQVSVEPSTAAGVDSSSSVPVSDGVRGEGTEGCGPARDEEAMETDTVIEQAGVGSATAITSVS